MRGVHILGGRRRLACALPATSKGASFLRVFSLVLVIACMLGTASCVGVTSKSTPAGSGSPSADVTPSSVNFGNVTVGTTDTQTVRLANTGTADLKITKISASGTGFSASGLSIPETIGAGQSTTFTASFKPTGTGAHTGDIAILSNAGSTPLSIPLMGSGVTTNAKLSASTTSLNFGTIAVGTVNSQNVQLKNTGNTNVEISSVATAGTGFASSGGVNVTLTPNQSVEVAVSFDPRAPGGVAGTLTISSNAPTVHVALAGQGAGAHSSHAVSLSWAPSISAVIGYNVYRGSASGGPYTRLNPSVELLTGFTDHSVLGGEKYYYVVTAIDGKDLESTFSNQASITVPTP
jgi:HYDIN/CFA65/VesB family protein/centrosomal CEP192-like protein